MSDPRPVLKEHLGRLVRFEPPDRALDEAVDDLRALHLYALRNGAPPETVEALGRCGRLGARALALHVSSSGMEAAVGHNFKAMVYATLDHALIRTVLASSNWNLFTLLTTGASFVLDRMSEYEYVRSARVQRDSVVANLQADLAADMWEALAHNPQTAGISWDQCLACRDLVGRVRRLLAASPSAAPAQGLAILLLYTAMLQALQTLDPSTRA